MATPESNKKTRAKHACRSCNSRRVKCNVIERQPCSNCSTTGAKCEILPSRRGRYPRRSQRLQPQMATDDAGISLNPRLKTDMDQGTPSSAKENPFTRADDLCGGRDSATDGIARPLQRIAPAPPSPPPDQPPSDPPLASASASVSASAPLGHPNKPSPTSPASGTLFFGESNFLTLVPSEEAAAAAAAGHSFSQKPRLTFPIPGSPSSSTYADGRGISASTMRYLRDEGALTLPDLRTCLPALQAYFTWFHPSFPVVDRAEITRRLAAMNISPFLLQAMLFIGATYCGDDTIVAMGFRDRAEAKRLLYTRARLLFHADWEKDEMILIQSIFLMSFWRGGPADVRDVRYWLGVVVTLSESYGLHRSPKSSMSKDAHATRMRRRIWWSIYVRERQVAAALGLPSRVRDEDCDMDPLDVGDLESETDGPSSGLFGTCQAEHITYAIKMVEMARLRTNEPPCHPPSPRVLCQPASSTVADVGGLDHALESWKKSLPNGMKCATDEGSESVWTCLLHLAYNHLRILLHLNSFLRSGDGTGEDDKHNQVVTTAACRIGRIAEDMYTHGTLRYGQMHL
ncbi:hypothetical protein RJ55_03122 [Drechmeria coniospora]|nr:hypothetical protein RJ55_03122 [Drechmeria coniospora]